jgi:hypothetical protein
VEIFDELGHDQLNEIVAKNVPLETLEFFTSYARDFCDRETVGTVTGKRVPNLMLLGYLLRVLEDRLLPDQEPFDA